MNTTYLPIRSALTALLLTGMAPLASGGDTKEGAPTAEELEGVLDLSMPTSPAFTLLGLTPETVSNPQTGADLAAALLDGLDARGNAQTGVALDFRPYMLAAGDRLTLWNYKQEPWKRQLARISLSVATASGKSDADEADRYAIGLKWVPIDDADPRTDDKVGDCFRDVLGSDSDGTDETPPNPDGEPITVSPLNADLAKKLATCRDEFKSRTWNGRSLQFGIATFRVNVDDLKQSGTGFWTSYSHPVGTRGQLIFHARELHDELVPPDEGETGFQRRDGRSYGLRARYGGGAAYFMVEAMKTDNQWASAREDDSFRQYAIGTEFRLAKGIWLQLSYGKARGKGAPQDDAVFASQLRFGFTRERLMRLGL